MSRPACSAGETICLFGLDIPRGGERVAEGTPNSHWHTLVVVPHLVKGGFVFGGKYGGGKQPTSPKKAVLRRPI